MHDPCKQGIVQILVSILSHMAWPVPGAQWIFNSYLVNRWVNLMVCARVNPFNLLGAHWWPKQDFSVSLSSLEIENFVFTDWVKSCLSVSNHFRAPHPFPHSTKEWRCPCLRKFLGLSVRLLKIVAPVTVVLILLTLSSLSLSLAYSWKVLC